jgi:site-specific DNA recombinase
VVAALADPDRGWDAVVIGEYERAFYGGQYASMAPLFEHSGIQLWTPEVGGRIDFYAEDHEQTMLALGFQSKREITRTKIRVRTAMATQTREQGRYLGGRPRTGTGWQMLGRTRTRPTRRGDGGRTACSPTRTRRPS